MGMANVLNEEKKQQVIALGRLGWSLRRIQQTTKIRRETASAYLKAAGIAVRPPSGWGRRAPKPANQVITDSGAAKPAIPVIPGSPNPNPEKPSNKGKAKATSKPANEVITDSEVIADLNPSQPDEVGALAPETGRGQAASPQPSPRASACEPYREAIELGLSRGRNARAIWQDLVCEYGFASSYQSVQRFVRKRRGAQVPEARVVIVTAPGQEALALISRGRFLANFEQRYAVSRGSVSARLGALDCHSSKPIDTAELLNLCISVSCIGCSCDQVFVSGVCRRSCPSE